MQNTRHISVGFQFSGVHHWAEAPEPVGFLRNPHRHQFIVHVTIPVCHGNRDVEFFIFKDILESFPKDKYIPYHPDLLGTYSLYERSCEMVAQELCEWLQQNHGIKYADVTVSEDGENAGSYSILPD